MKNRYFFVYLSLIALVAPNLAHCAANNLTVSEYQFLLDCEYNISNPQLLEPRSAAYCQQRLQDGLYAKWVIAEPVRARKLVSAVNALVNLNKNLYMFDYEEKELSTYLANQDMLQLGITETRQIVGWTNRYLPESLNRTKQALREWDTLQDAQKAWFLENKVSREQYQGASVAWRNNALNEWAEKKADEILQSVAPESEAGLRKLLDSAIFLYRDLGDGVYGKLLAHLKKVINNLAANNPDLADSLAKDYGYDSPVISRQEVKQGWSGPLTKEEETKLAELLRPAIIEEIKDTETGVFVIIFYKKLAQQGENVSFACGDIGSYIAVLISNSITIGSGAVTDWLVSKGYSPAELFTDTAKMAALAEYMAPAFVHESVHAKQANWVAAMNIPNFTFKERELETHARQALFVLQKAALRGDGYFDRLMALDKQHALLFKQYGLNGFFGRLNNDYADTESVDGAIAKLFDLNVDVVAMVEARDKAWKANPGAEAALDAQRYTYGQFERHVSVKLDDVSTIELKEHLKEIDRWYKLYRKQVTADLAEIQTQLERL